MADDQNKSDKPINKSEGKVNGKMPKHIREAFESREYNVSYEHLSGKEDVAKLSDKLEALENAKATLQQGTPEYQSAVENMGYIEADLAAVESAHASRYNEQLASTLTTYSKTRNINERTTTMSSQQRFFRQAKGSDDRFLPTEMIEGRIQGKTEEAHKLGQELAGRTRGLGTEDMPDSLRNKATRMQELQEEIAFDKRLLKVQSKEGLSTEKRQYAAADTLNRAGGFIADEALKQEVSSGKYGSLDDETKKLTEMFSNLTSALSRFEEASENATDEQGNLTQEYREASDELDRLQRETEQQRRVVGEVSRQGGGGGSFFGKYGGYIQMGAMAGQAISATAQSTYTIAGQQDITQMNNRAAFARMGNVIYDKAERAVMGNDVEAALDIAASDQFAKEYADRNRRMKHVTGGISSVTDILTDVATSTMKGAGAGAGIGFLAGGIGAGPGALIGGGAGLLSGLAGSVPKLTNLFYGNEGANASIQSYEAAKQLTSEERKIRAGQMQSFYNQGLGLYNAGTGLGNMQSYAMQGNLMNSGVLADLAQRGVSATQAISMTGQLGAAGQFDPDEGLNMIRAAGTAAQRGQMSREGYMSAAAQLRMAGGGNDDLQEIIATATARGMDNSANISQMVEASIGMSAGLANLGVSGTNAVQGMLGANVTDLVDRGVDKNIAIGMAANNMANYNQQITDSGFNLGNIVERQQLRQNPNFSGASIFQLNQLSQMSSQEHQIFRSARDGDEEAMKQAKLLARNKGITGLMFDADGQVKSGSVNALGGSALQGMLLNVGSAGINRNIEKKVRAGTDLSDEERAVLAQAGVTEETVRATLGVSKAGRSPVEMHLERDGQKRDITAANREQRNIAMGEKYAKEMDPSKKAFENIEQLMSNLNEAVSPEKFGDVVKGAAESFRVPVADFGGHVGKFGAVIENLQQQQAQMLKMMGENRGADYSGIPSKDK